MRWRSEKFAILYSDSAAVLRASSRRRASSLFTHPTTRRWAGFSGAFKKSTWGFDYGGCTLARRLSRVARSCGPLATRLTHSTLSSTHAAGARQAPRSDTKKKKKLLFSILELPAARPSVDCRASYDPLPTPLPILHSHALDTLDSPALPPSLGQVGIPRSKTICGAI